MKKSNSLELPLYAVFGVATTLVNIGVYQGALSLLHMDYWVSNLIALIASKIFAYIVNKKFVFRSKCEDKKALCKEMIRFIFARGATGLIDYFGLLLAVEVFAWNQIYSKYVLQAIVILLNFILGKKAVFVSGAGRQNISKDRENG